MRVNDVSTMTTHLRDLSQVYIVKNDDSKLFQELNTLKVGHRILMTGVSNIS